MDTDPHEADRGHTFRFVVTSRMSSKVEGDEHYEDAPDFSGVPLTLDVRAWNLPDALRSAAGAGLVNWTHVIPEEPEFLLDADGSLWTYQEHDEGVPIYQSAEKDAVFPLDTVEKYHGPLTVLRRG